MNKKIVFITGVSRGIGLELAKCFLNDGYFVIGTSRSEFNLSSALGSENCLHLPLDVTNRDQISSCIKKLKEEDIVPNVLINNAGITGSTSSLWDYDVDEWNKIVQINLMGTFNCCKCVVPYMIKNDYGRIVNIASIAGKEGNPNASAYSTSKAGVIGLTKSLGKELAQKNIAVNCVTPAAAKTRIFDQMTEEHINYMLSKIPRNKFAKVEELASLVAWLSCEENSFSTAAVFDLSGGRATY